MPFTGPAATKNMLCIYCLEDKTKEFFLKREHILPQCLGTFSPNNLILYETVCDVCNEYFGNVLELNLGRDTIEGIERYKLGIKPDKQPKHKRLRFKIAEGELTGIIVTPKPSDIENELDIDPVLQVGIFNEMTGRFDYYDDNDPYFIPSLNDLKAAGRKTDNLRFDFIAKDDVELQFFVERLRAKGFKDIKLESPKEWPEDVKRRNRTWVAGEIRIDRIIYRAFCKIVFNYLAYVQGKDFVLSGNFDEIRRFIRYDQGSSDDFFFVNQPPILENDRKFLKLGIKETRGHLIALEWNDMALQGRLSLFNLNTYLIRLCKHFDGIWTPIKSGHHFDVESWAINPMFSVSRRLLLG